MKSKQIKTMTVDDMKAKVLELRRDMIKYSSQIASGASIKSPALVKNTKKTIARLLFEIQNKEISKDK